MFTATLDPGQALLVVVVTVFASIIGGVAGYGTGLLLPPVLVPLIGAEATVPVIGLSALLTNASRLVAYREHFDMKRARTVTLAAMPFVVLGALGYSLLSGQAATIFIGLMLIVLVPVRRFAKKFKGELRGRALVAAGAGYGVVTGGTAGAGVILVSTLLAAGLTGPSVIATDAGISIIIGSLKSLTFWTQGDLPWPMILIGLLIGIAAIPGAFIAKRLALKLSGEVHILILDAAVILGGILLVWRGLTG